MRRNFRLLSSLSIFNNKHVLLKSTLLLLMRPPLTDLPRSNISLTYAAAAIKAIFFKGLAVNIDEKFSLHFLRLLKIHTQYYLEDVSKNHYYAHCGIQVSSLDISSIPPP